MSLRKYFYTFLVRFNINIVECKFLEGDRIPLGSSFNINIVECK